MASLDKETEEMRVILKESDMAFSILMESGGVSNVDFAQYTSDFFIRSFRHVMQQPDLSRAQLASMIRNAEHRKRRRNNDENWANFMAHVISNQSNNNHLNNSN
jgi:hypothetical protein